MLLHAAGNVTLYVWASGDIVSNELQRSRTWEQAEIAEWLWALKQWTPPSAATALLASVSGGASMPDRPLAVDIGANLGWFTINAAMAGARVAAFEGELLRELGWLHETQACPFAWLMRTPIANGDTCMQC
jgi:hypothetical protein